MDNDRLKREALNGDKEAALKMVQIALRKDRWDLAALVTKMVAEGEEWENVLTPIQGLYLGRTHFKDLCVERLNIPLPDDLVVDGLFSLKSPEIKSLPESMKVGGDFSIMHSRNIPSLPNGLKIGGSLILCWCTIKIPEDTEVGEGICISNSNVTSLPDNLTLDWLNIEGSTIEDFPKGLKVGRLMMKDSKIKRIPEGVVITHSIECNRSTHIPSVFANVRTYISD